MWLKYVPLVFMVPAIIFAIVVCINMIIIRLDVTEVEDNNVLRYYTNKNHFMGRIVKWTEHLLVIPFHGGKRVYKLDELDKARTYLVHSTSGTFRYAMLHLWAKKIEKDLNATGIYTDG